MRSIGVTGRSRQTPSRSSIRRLAYDSASGRNTGGAEAASTSATRSADPRKARASVQPTRPAPRIRTSTLKGRTSTAGAGIAHQRFDVLGKLGRLGGDDLAATRRHHDVVLDAYADVAQRFRHVIGRPDVEPGLDGERHPRRAAAPIARALVLAGIVHVQAEP